VVNVDVRILLSLSVNPSNSLVIILQIPSDTEPYNVMARILQIKTVSHGSGMAQKDRYASGVESLNKTLEGFRREPGVNGLRMR
jgi:hypothetical protein